MRLLGPNPSTDYKDGQALLFKYSEVHVMSNSWGPNDDGKTMSYFGPQTRSALKTGVTKVTISTLWFSEYKTMC